MSDSERLLPCPFCGGPGFLDQRDPGMDRAPPYWFAGCKACGYTLKAVYTAKFIPCRGYVHAPTAMQDAIDAFNRRANKPLNAAEVGTMARMAAVAARVQPDAP